MSDFSLRPPKSRSSRLEARIAAVLASHVGLDRDAVRTVLLILPDASDAEAALLAENEHLFTQVARGNLAASERMQLYRKYREFQAALPGLGSGLFNLALKNS